MIRTRRAALAQSGYRFSETIVSNKTAKRNHYSKKSDPALAPRRLPGLTLRLLQLFPEIVDHAKHRVVALGHEAQQQLQLGVRVAFPIPRHGLLQRLVESPDLRERLRHDRDKDLTSAA